MNIWISYNISDKKFVDKLKESLIGFGHLVLLGNDNLVAGENIIPKIEKSIKISDAFLIIFSKESQKSRWLTYEVFIILNEVSKKSNSKKMIPIILDKGLKLPPIIDQITYVDFTNQVNYLKSLDFLKNSLESSFNQNIFETEKDFLFLLKEEEKMLDYRKREYLIRKDKREDTEKFFRFTTSIVTVTAIISSFYLIHAELNMNRYMPSNMSISGIIFYFLGILTTIIPTFYYFKNKHDK